MRVLLCFFLLTLGSAAFAAEWTDLFRDGNRTELERLGGQAGAQAIAVEIASGERPKVLAALRAAPGAADSWALLGALAHIAEEPDRSLALEAALVATELSHGLDEFMIEEQEIPRHDLLLWHQAWVRVATTENRWIDIRIYALEVAGVLHALLQAPVRPEFAWKSFFEDADDEMRAAAIQLAPRSQALLVEAARLVKDDKIDRVALSAAQRLCGPIGSVDIAASKSLDESTMNRLRKLATNNALAFSSRVDLANCLVADASDKSRRALAALVQASPPPLRRALVALTQPKAP
jgi:hypothetical protein